MPQELISQFNRNFALPIETYRQVQTVALRDSIPTNRRWEGMIVYVVTDSLSYILVGGVANSQWVELGTLVDVQVVDNLLSTSPTDALSANQGRVLKDLIDNIDLSDYQLISEKGMANGYAPLDSGAKVPLANLPDSILGQVSYQGTWNASTNSPTLSDPTTSATKGHYYVTSVGGTQFGISFAVGDWVISNGVNWQKVDNTDAVTSVFGRLGNVVANTGDYTFAQIGSKPTTLSGYGITDAVTIDTGQTITSWKKINPTVVAPDSGSKIITIGDSGSGSFLSSGNLAGGGFSWILRGYASSGVQLVLSDGGITVQGNTVWNAGNDGSGSGLDADLLDGQQGANYMRVNAATTNTNGTNSISKDTGALILTAGGLGVEQAIFSGGNMNAPNFVLTSDRRKKKNIEPIKVDRLPIDWKQFELKDFPNELRYGAIAQEVQKLAPELVSVNGKGELSLKYIDLLVRKIAELENYIYGGS